jgi:hypothetical protein
MKRISDVEYTDRKCVRCGNFLSRRPCDNPDCEDGLIDEYASDPINFEPGEECHQCPDCDGGHVYWCPTCIEKGRV